MTHTIVLQDTKQLTHDTYHLTFNRPAGYNFAPGQATELAFQKNEIADKGRPFTMVSQPDDPTLEFVIKSYPDHDGVTEHIPAMAIGDTAKAKDPFGAITDHGPGVFLAAGAGITPFIPILKKHDREGVMGDKLLFSNKTDADIILKETWTSLPGVTPVFVVTDQDDTAHHANQIDKAFLQDQFNTTDQPFYICGPGRFVDAMRDALTDLGVSKDNLVIEDGW